MELRDAETILVPFRGNGGGVDALSWGQCEIWRPMMAVGSSFPLGATFPAPPGTTVASVADVFDFGLCADTHRLAPADMVTLVRSVEDVFVTAALDL